METVCETRLKPNKLPDNMKIPVDGILPRVGRDNYASLCLLKHIRGKKTLLEHGCETTDAVEECYAG